MHLNGVIGEHVEVILGDLVVAKDLCTLVKVPVALTMHTEFKIYEFPELNWIL